MNEEVEVIYPSDDEIREHVSFIVTHASPKKLTIIEDILAYIQSLFIVRLYLIIKITYHFYKSAYKSFDIRYIFQNYLEVIVFGLMLAFNFLIPSTS